MHALAGEAHLAALHLLSVADVAAALGVYKRAGLLAEARLLAAARLPLDHAEQRELRAAHSEPAAAQRMDALEPAAETIAERQEGEAQPAQPPSAGEQPAAALRRRYSRAELEALRAAAPAPAPGTLRCLPPAVAM